MARGRPVKALTKKEIEKIVEEKIRGLLAEVKIEGKLILPGRRGRPFGYSPKTGKRKTKA